jgi:hypothetical protein
MLSWPHRSKFPVGEALLIGRDAFLVKKLVRTLADFKSVGECKEAKALLTDYVIQT